MEGSTRMKKINMMTMALLVYLLVLGIIGWPGDDPDGGYTGYLCTMGATLVIILLLRYLQIKRLKMRDKWGKPDGEQP